MTFDKTKVVPPEYARVLDQNIKFHFLEETGVTLHTIDDSDFNIVISNNQKIIVKKKRKADTPADVLFGTGSLLTDIYGDDGDDDVWDDASLIDNQRFKKLCRLPQLGVYVDEAHHLFGANLEKELRSGGANKTTLRNTINMLAASTSIVACYNYTGIARYSVMHGNEQLFASKYKLYLPTKEELKAEIETQKAMFYLQQQESEDNETE